MSIEWSESKEGFMESLCGSYHIEPTYWNKNTICDPADCYELLYNLDGEKRKLRFETQQQCTEFAVKLKDILQYIAQVKMRNSHSHEKQDV